MDVWTAIVLAAGKGTRMKSTLPKVLHPVAGLPLVAHALRAVQGAGPTSIVVVTSPEHRESVKLALVDDVECVDQHEPLGTGHALATALMTIAPSSRQVIVMNGDVPLVRSATVGLLAELHERRGATLTLLTCFVPPDFLPQAGRLQRGARGKPIGVVESGDVSSSTRDGREGVEINVGVYAFEVSWLRRALSAIRPRVNGEYYLTDLVSMAIADGRRVEAYAYHDSDEALSVNNRRDLARAEVAMQRRLRDAAMDMGATLEDPSTTYLDTLVTVEHDVTVHPNTSLRGSTHVSTGAIVGPNAHIRDSRLGPGSRVDSAVVEDSVLGANAKVGPFSHLRPGTTLENDAFVGSHVEIKGSRIGARTHIGHFSYIGDAFVGADANIGAGTVTCNFDGFAKHVTEVGDRAFIGSDSLLIAPVKIGADALTGAGSVVKENVPPGGRVAGVPARPLGAKRAEKA